MATQVQFRRGTTVETSTFTGASGEVTVDTTKNTCVVHDGTTVGGFPLLRQDGVNSALSSGSLSSPALKFANSTNTGLYSQSAGALALVTGGAARLLVDSSGAVSIPGNLSVSGSIIGALAFADGTAASPSIRFSNYPTTGLYIAGANQLGISTAGTSRLVFDSTGQIEAVSLGSAAAPTFSFTTDPNTGIYSPGADQLAISTNGTGRLFVDASGRLSLGTSTTSRVAEFNLASGNNGVRVSNNGNTASDFAVLDFVQNSGQKFVIYSNQENTTANANSGAFVLQTGAQERLRVTAAGLVGIGTSSPAALFHVNGSSSGRIALFGTGTSYQDIALSGTTDAGNGTIVISPGTIPGSGTAEFYTYFKKAVSGGSTTNHNVIIDGKVGIGTTNVSSLLHLRTANSGTPQAALRIEQFNAAATRGHRLEVTVDPDNDIVRYNATGDGAGNHVFQTGGNERARITSAGLVGIGTSAPGSNLDLAGTTSRIRWDVNNAYTLATHGNAAFSAFASSVQSAADYQYQIAGIEKMRLDSSGRLGIGTTSPTQLLSIAGSSANILLAGTSNSYTTYNINASNVGYVGDANWMFGGSSSDFGVRATSNLVFGIGANEAARFDSSRRLLVGTSTARTTANTSNVSQLQIEAAGTYAAQSISTNSNDGTGAYLSFVKSRGTTPGSSTLVSSGDAIGLISFDATDGTSPKTAAYILASVDATPGANDMPGRISFHTTTDGASSPTERMRIGNAGNINTFATATDGINSRVSTTAGTTNHVFAGLHSATSTGDGTVSFRVWSNGNVINTNNSYGAISDLKLKENIVDATSQWSDIKALQVRKYNFKEGQTHTQIGLIAQEVELVSPGLVSESPDRDAEGNDLGTVTKSVNYSVLYMKAVKALQEAMLRIEDLEARLDAANL